LHDLQILGIVAGEKRLHGRMAGIELVAEPITDLHSHKNFVAITLHIFL
jgi:hypothetical protein